MEDNKKKNSFHAGFGDKLIQWITALCIKIAAGLLLGMKLKTDPQVRQWKKSKDGFVILCAHPSEVDAVLLLASAFPRYARFVAGEQQLYKQNLQGKLLRMLKVIPKKQFTADIKSVREMITTVKSGYILAMMPEGRVSSDGTPSPIDISTGKLIKNLKANVAVLIPHGTFFVKPPYDYAGLIRGKIRGDILPALTAEQIAGMTPEEILSTLQKALDYNASRELEGSGKTYGKAENPHMEHVSRLFYLCPVCGKAYTVTDENSVISCSACGARGKLTHEMFIEGGSFPRTVAEWNALQKDCERRQLAEEPVLEFKVKKTVLDLAAVKNAEKGSKTVIDYTDGGEGILTLSAESFKYEDSSEAVEVPLSLLPGVSADYMYGYIILYQGDLIRRFYFDDIRSVMRFVNRLMVLKENR